MGHNLLRETVSVGSLSSDAGCQALTSYPYTLLKKQQTLREDILKNAGNPMTAVPIHFHWFCAYGFVYMGTTIITNKQVTY